MDKYITLKDQHDIEGLREAYKALTVGFAYRVILCFQNGGAMERFSRGESFKLDRRIQALKEAA